MSNNNETLDDLLLNDPEMIESFVAEAREHLETIEDDFLSLERQKDDPDQAQLDKVFRAIHSVKGAAGFLGLSKMSELAHVMEALLTMMRSGKILPETEYIDSLLAGVDLLSTMLNNIKQSNEVDITLVYDQISTYHKKETDREKPPEKQPVKKPVPAKESKDDRKDLPQPAEKSDFDIGSTVRINIDLLDKLMVQAGELVLIRNQHLLTVDESDPVSRSIAHRLDLITSELQETIINTRMQPVGKVIDKFPRVVRDLGKSLGKQIQINITGSNAEIDKTILESLTDPLTHIIRNSCGHGIESPEERSKAGKPKTGLISISAYHEAGRVNIKISDDGKGVDTALICKKVVEKGLKSEAELEQMSHQDILNLVFLPGFSTMDVADGVSGRGVGMDVVKTSIEKLGGSFEFESRTGEGTTILLQLPLTLAIIPSLIVTSGEQLYAIPQVSLVELVSLYDDEILTRIERADDHEVYRLRDRLLPLVRLSEVLARPRLFDRDTRAEIAEKYYQENFNIRRELLAEGIEEDRITLDKSLNIVVLKVGTSHFGMIVDDILGTEEIVVKPLHSSLKAMGIYSGATIMGNGKTALILDVGGIARHTGITLAEKIMADRELEFKGDEMQSVLLFKSGPKEQFALALPLIRRIEPFRITDVELIGDKEYISIDGVSTLILKLENMLNVSPIEQHEQMFLILPRNLRRPVGILMSSYIDVVDTTVELDIESYKADGLLGTAIMNGSMTLFLDFYRLVEIIEPEYFGSRKVLSSDPVPEETRPVQILLLEDISFFRHLIKGYLEAEGYHVTAVKNGRLGFDQFDENSFDLIVSDLEMPVMNGWEFIKNVRRNKILQDIPAVALTSLDNAESRQRAIENGFNFYEVKLDREHFLATISEALGRVKTNQ
jgi:two-component system chemotaxis sensor kinase CheA